MKHPELATFYQSGPPMGGGGPDPLDTSPYAVPLTASRYSTATDDEVSAGVGQGDVNAIQEQGVRAQRNLREEESRRVLHGGTPQTTYQQGIGQRDPQTGAVKSQMLATAQGQEAPHRVKLRAGMPGADIVNRAASTELQRQAGQAQPFDPWIKTPGRPGKYSKRDVALEAALGARRKAQYGGAALGRSAIAGQMIEQTAGWLSEARNESMQAGMDVDNASAKYQAAAKSLQGSRADLERFKVDPDRYWKSMPQSQQLLTRLGLFLGGLAEGLTGGKVKSAAMQMLLAAEGRDMQAQRMDFQKLLRKVNLDERQQDAMLKRYDAAEQKRHVTGLRVMQLQLSRMGLMEKRLGHKEKYAELINGVDQYLLGVVRQSRGTGGGKKVNPYAMAQFQSNLKTEQQAKLLALKTAGAKKKGERGEKAIDEALRWAPKILEWWDSGKAWRGDWDWSTEGVGQNYKAVRTMLSVSLWRLFDSGKLSDFDMKKAEESFFPDPVWTTGLTPLQAQGHRQKIIRMMKWLGEKKKEGLGDYSNPPERSAYWKNRFGIKGQV